MKCIYSDGLKINYSGTLQIIKGQDVNVFIKEELIPDSIKSDLEMALFRSSCGAMRKVAETVTGIYGKKACIHE
jgi:hypothetical protein